MVRTALTKAFLIVLVLAVLAQRCAYPPDVVDKMADCARDPMKYGKAYARQCGP